MIELPIHRVIWPSLYDVRCDQAWPTLPSEPKPRGEPVVRSSAVRVGASSSQSRGSPKKTAAPSRNRARAPRDRAVITHSPGVGGVGGVHTGAGDHDPGGEYSDREHGQGQCGRLAEVAVLGGVGVGELVEGPGGADLAGG